MSTKKIIGKIKLQIIAGKASPAPPIGPALGQKGLNIMEFCKAFNAATKDYEPNCPVNVIITAYEDKKFTFELKGTPVSYLIKKVLNLEKGSQAPGRQSAGVITRSQLEVVAKQKMQDGLSAYDIDQAINIVAGSARSMGLQVRG